MAALIAVYVYWNYFPLATVKTDAQGVTFKAPGISVSQQDLGAGLSGSAEVDYTRLNMQAYRALQNAAEIYGKGNRSSPFEQALAEIQLNARPLGSVEKLISQQHKNFIFF